MTLRVLDIVGGTSVDGPGSALPFILPAVTIIAPDAIIHSRGMLPVAPKCLLRK